MNLKEEILKEHSKVQTMKIVHYVSNDPNRFHELMLLFLGNEYRVTQRCSWAVSYTVEKHTELIQPYLKKIIKNLNNTSIHNAVKRNTLRLLQFIDIPENLQGITFEICFRFLVSKNEPIAVKVFAMTVLANICKIQPDLKNELLIAIENQFSSGSAGFKARAKMVIKQLNTFP